MPFRMNVILEEAGKIRKIRAFKDILATCFNLGAVLRGDWKGSYSGMFLEGQLSPEVPVAGAPAAPRPDACRLLQRRHPWQRPAAPLGSRVSLCPATAPPLARRRQLPGREGSPPTSFPQTRCGWGGPRTRLLHEDGPSQPAQGSGDQPSEKEPGDPLAPVQGASRPDLAPSNQGHCPCPCTTGQHPGVGERL